MQSVTIQPDAAESIRTQVAQIIDPNAFEFSTWPLTPSTRSVIEVDVEKAFAKADEILAILAKAKGDGA